MNREEFTKTFHGEKQTIPNVIYLKTDNIHDKYMNNFLTRWLDCVEYYDISKPMREELTCQHLLGKVFCDDIAKDIIEKPLKYIEMLIGMGLVIEFNEEKAVIKLGCITGGEGFIVAETEYIEPKQHYSEEKGGDTDVPLEP